jgi:hypothetical protein
LSLATAYDDLHAAMEATREMTYASAVAILRGLFEGQAFPASVVDFGSGRGDWLRAARDCGASELLGIDSFGSTPDRVQVDVIRHDLTKVWSDGRTRDLALSVETAEHLPASGAAALVESLTRAAPCCVFSAAVPMQGGVGHVNEQPPAYWAALFAERGFECVDPRLRFWDRQDIEPWYRQNLLVFRRPGTLRWLDALATRVPPHLVHPMLFEAWRRGTGADDVVWRFIEGAWHPQRYVRP